MSFVPLGKLPEQVVPHEIPAGLEVIVPEPVRSMVTRYIGIALNVAVAARSAVIVTVQVFPRPEQAPDHPSKLEPKPGASVNVTEVPGRKDPLHVFPSHAKPG